MNRREALIALTSLPQVARISVAPVQPNDVIVIESEKAMSEHTADLIRKYVKTIWPNQRCVVLSDGLKLKVVAGDAVTK